MSFYKKINKGIFGYDVFISYSRSDSLDYAYVIAQHLIRKGYECYIDQLSSVTPGLSLPKNIQDAVKNTNSFVLIGSSSSKNSEPIKEEIALFLEGNKNKPLIPITIDGAINEDAIWYSEIMGLPLIVDTTSNLKDANPAKDVLDRIENALKFTKKNKRLRNISLVIFLATLSITSLAAYLSYVKIKDAQQATADKNMAEEQKKEALSQKEEAMHQKNMALLLKRHADSLKTIAYNEKDKAEKLKGIADSLQLIAQKNLVTLNIQSNSQQFRIAAMNTLEADPEKAYRLAQKAYSLNNNVQNREVLMNAISSVDYYYKSVCNNYRILDFKEPYILLTKTDVQDTEYNLAIYDMRTDSIRNASVHGDHAWIVPFEHSYRILTRNFKGNGSEAIPEYQLWSDSFRSIGGKIQERGLSIAQFPNNHTVIIKLKNQNQLAIWDLNSNIIEHIDETHSKSFDDDYYYQIYGSLATRSDGIFAGHYKNGLVLVKSGKIDTSSYTAVEFDPSSFFSRAQWSPDDGFLGLNYFDRKRLGIWDPAKHAFIWLDPDGWVVDAFSWSQTGHLLAFSGRTENDVDVTVEIVDASQPEKTRKVVYHTNIPIQSIAFLHGNRQIVVCDKESNMFIIDIETKKIIGRGHQADVVKSSNFGYYSSSKDNFKSWSTSSAPSKQWFFASDSNRTYSPQGASDPENKWLAVPFFQRRDTTNGIELRNIITGERKSLLYPSNYVHRIVFSEDAHWLILETSDNLYFWNTNSWEYYNFSLIQNDRQFINLKIMSNKLYTKLAEDSAGYEISYVFEFMPSKVNFIQRIVTKKRPYIEEEQEPTNNVENLVKGWKTDKLYKYQASGWDLSGKWAVRLTCRDGSLGANDCDVLFIPTDIAWIMKVHERLLWKPSDEELERWVIEQK